MNLAEFFDIDTGSFARAFAALREALTKHALELWKQEERDFSPWTLILGKGGPKPGGGYYPATEQSLYRRDCSGSQEKYRFSDC